MHLGSILESPIYDYRVFERFFNLAVHVPNMEHAIPKAFKGDDHLPFLFTGALSFLDQGMKNALQGEHSVPHKILV